MDTGQHPNHVPGEAWCRNGTHVLVYGKIGTSVAQSMHWVIQALTQSNNPPYAASLPLQMTRLEGWITLANLQLFFAGSG